MFDATSGDVYEIARTQGGGDPIVMRTGHLAVKMRDEFFIRTTQGVIERKSQDAGKGGDYLVVHNQKQQRMAIPSRVFEFFFDVRQ